MEWRARSGLVVVGLGQAMTDFRLRVSGSAGPPPPPSEGPYLSLILRLPEQPLSGACRAASEILDGTGAHLYPPSTVHLTLLSLDDGVDPADVEPALPVWAQGRAPLRVGVRRVGYSTASAFLELRGGEGLLSARRSLARAIGLRRRGLARIRDTVAVANFARFRAPLRREVALRLRRIRLPEEELPLADLELVLTDKVLSDAGTQVLTRVRLGA
jgi:hypothetical protein